MSTTVGEHDFYIKKGATWNQKITFKNDDDTVKNLTGYTAQMQFRRFIDSSIMIELTTENGKIEIPSPTNGILYLKLTAAETSALTHDSMYDLELTKSGIVETPLMGNILLLSEVTRLLLRLKKKFIQLKSKKPM